MNYQEKLHAIRAIMLEKNIDAYIISSSDPHMSEYVPDHYKCIQFLSGFTGSAGTLVITATFAGLWTDFRYFQQAAQQLQGSGFELVKLKIQHTPEYIEWIYKTLPNECVVAFNFQLLSVSVAEQIKNSLAGKQIAIKDFDLIDHIWQERPTLPNHEAVLLSDKDCGQTFDDKLNALRSELVKNHSNVHILSSLDDLAWLFNIRGDDVSFNPVVLCYAIITLENVTLYINSSQFSSADLKGILDQTIQINDYHQITTDIANLQNCTVLLDEKRTCYQFLTLLSLTVTVIKQTNPVVYLKSIKNKVEIENIKNAMLQDGIALTRFFKWLEENVGKSKITEISAAQKIEEFRQVGENFVGLSFSSISGYSLNAALPHYSPSEQSNLELLPKGLFLLDSGAHYLYGTTDVTRTIPLGETTEQERRDYTLVLSALIFGSAVKFPQDTRGYQIDGIVRQQLWQHGINYGHGTGHGVGYYLNVHEGPQNIGPSNAPVSVDLGMLTSIEPGIYRPGKHGVRIENLVLTVNAQSTDFGSFLAFETLTLAHIDTSIVLLELLLPEQVKWLNGYNQMVYDFLQPHLDNDEVLWLAAKCRAI